MNTVVRWFLLAALIACASCSPSERGDEVTELPRPQQTISDHGKGGLELVLTTVSSIEAGRRFELTMEVRDDAGDSHGFHVDFGDGQEWGGVPMDLVCMGRMKGEKPHEPPSRDSETLTHSYPESGTYEVLVETFSGGCQVDHETARLWAEIEVTGAAGASNGPQPPRAKIGHAYYTNGDPSILVTDIGGYDDDGFVSRVEVDWGDGSAPETFTRPLSECEQDRGWPTGWFSDMLDHVYPEPGLYEVAIEVTSVGCDGEDAQTDTESRVLRYPPEQGS